MVRPAGPVLNTSQGMASGRRMRHRDRMAAPARSDDFAIALRGWRERRRLSQLELALRANTTQRHVSFIERGRSIPGRGMVVRLAESLELPLREQNELLRAAGYAPVHPETPLQDPSLEAVRDALQRILDGHEPYPAIVARRGGVLLASNRASRILTGGAARHLLEPPINSLRLALHPEGMAPRVLNFGEWARHLVEGFRRQVERNPDPHLEDLLAELLTYVPPFRPSDHEPALAVPLHLATEAGELRLLSTCTTFQTAADVTVDELKLEAFLPADDDTAGILAALARARRR
jgi:transcriptional regulator with XRE-family HTH domain